MSYPNGGSADIWRDLEGGIPHKPIKAEIRTYLGALEMAAGVSRADFEAANVVAELLTANVGGLAYARDATGNALTSGDGATWSPAGDAQLAHWGLAGDGVTDETTTLNAALQKAVRAHEGNQYAYSAQLVISGTVTGTLQVKLLASITGDTPSISVTGSVENLEVEVPAGVAIRRVVRVSGKVGKLTIISADQQNNRDSTLDGATYMTGNGAAIGSVYVENFDNAFVAYLGDDMSLGRLRAKSYVRGAFFRELNNIECGCIYTSGRSANATTDPGHNSVLLEQVHDSQFGQMTLYDAGEHGFRIGGDTGGLGCVNTHFAPIMAVRAGQCGLKINDSSLMTRNLKFSQVDVVDAKNIGAAAANKDGVRVEKSTDIHFGGVSVSTQDNSKSAHHGIYIGGCTRVSFGTTNIEETSGSMVYITDVIAGAAVSTLVNDSISFAHLTGAAIDGIGIEVVSTVEPIGNITVGGGYLRDMTGIVASVITNGLGGAAEISNPIVLTADYHNAAGPMTTSSGITRIVDGFTERT